MWPVSSQTYKATRKIWRHPQKTLSTPGRIFPGDLGKELDTASNNKVWMKWGTILHDKYIRTVKDKITVIFQNQLGTVIFQIPKGRKI